MNRASLGVAASAFAFLLSCRAVTPEEPVAKLTPPANPGADEAAARAVAKPLEILANKIEIILPPSLYPELTFRQETHAHREFQTKTGRRISLTPPAEASTRPAWALVGSWKLASFGPIDVLFAVEPGAAAARVRAHGVSVLARDGKTIKELETVSVDDEKVEWSPTR